MDSNNKFYMRLILLFLLYSSLSYSFTDKPIRVVFGFPEGSSQHFTFRKLQNSIINPLPIIVENRPGVGGGIAQQYVAQQSPTGRTLLYTSASIFTNPIYNKALTFDAMRDFDPIFYVGEYDQVLVVNTSLPSNLKELIVYTQRYPDKLSYGYNGQGSSTHRAPLGIFNNNVTGIPYKSTAQMMPDIIDNRVQMTMATVPFAKTFMDNPKIKLIATTGKKRNPAIPSIPTISETIPGFEQVIWHGIMAPKGIPKDIKKFLHDYFKSGTTEAFIKTMQDQGQTIVERDFDVALKAEYKRVKNENY
jgi:tripartite-type tricarboxylate transporter receptor subunit TctC